MSEENTLTTVLSVRVDKKLKAEASEILESYGLSIPVVLKMLLSNIVTTKSVPLPLDWQSNPQSTTEKEKTHE